MKIYVLTIHVGFNFGSSLQTIATHNILNRYCDDVVILNYYPPRVTYSRFFLNMFSSPKGFVKGLFSFPNYVINRAIYYSYLKRRVILSKPYYTKKDFERNALLGDVFIIGSDQVWNSQHNEGLDLNYYFNFLPNEKIKFSFASSFGREELPDEEYGKVKELLSKFEYLSVREKSGQRILETMGYEAEQLLDPTLLLSRDIWKNYMSKPLINYSYLLIYIPYNTISKDTIYRTARLISEEKKIKIVTFSWNYIPDFAADKTIFYANPSDFLSLVYNAQYVLTNSFHGTAFSINLNKQFWVYNPSVFSTRIDSLLELFDLNNRKLLDVIDADDINKSIDYIYVNDILEDERNKAVSYLSKALNC